MKPELQSQIDNQIKLLAVELAVDPNVIAFLLQQTISVHKLLLAGNMLDDVSDTNANHIGMEGKEQMEQAKAAVAGVITETINNAQNLGLIAKIPLLTLNAVSRKVDEVLLPMVLKGYSAPTPSLIYVEGNKTTQ